jgi:hypothetical protein
MRIVPKGWKALALLGALFLTAIAGCARVQIQLDDSKISKTSLALTRWTPDQLGLELALDIANPNPLLMRFRKIDFTYDLNSGMSKGQMIQQHLPPVSRNGQIRIPFRIVYPAEQTKKSRNRDWEIALQGKLWVARQWEMQPLPFKVKFAFRAPNPIQALQIEPLSEAGAIRLELFNSANETVVLRRIKIWEAASLDSVWEGTFASLQLASGAKEKVILKILNDARNSVPTLPQIKGEAEISRGQVLALVEIVPDPQIRQ